ncbi:MAG: melibiose:sodium transporter MelB, partial [Aeromonas sp.]
MAISNTAKLSYGIGALGKDLACSIVYLYLMYYYTDVVGISAAFVGTLFLFARVWDAFNDPMMGMMVDNTRSRFGKFRPWILIGTIINSIVMISVFFTHEFEGTALYIYTAVTYMLWGMTYTIMDIPYWSMIPAMSSDKNDREQIVVIPRLFASLAWFLMGTFGLMAIEWLGNGDQGAGFAKVSMLIAVVFILSAVITVLNVKEDPNVAINTQPKADSHKLKPRDVMKIILDNDQLKALIGIVLSFNLAMQLAGSFAIYYFTYALGKKELFAVFMGFSSAAEITGLILFPLLVRKLSRPMIWRLACAFPLMSYVMLWLTGMLSPENSFFIAASGVAMKLGSGFALAMSTLMLADVVDYGEYKMGVRSESVIFSVQTMLVKGAGAFAGFLTGIGLTVIGYQANTTQSPETIVGMQMLMIGVPAVLICISYVIYRVGYKLNGS